MLEKQKLQYIGHKRFWGSLKVLKKNSPVMTSSAQRTSSKRLLLTR
jgi:hypothetical protein